MFGGLVRSNIKYSKISGKFKSTRQSLTQCFYVYKLKQNITTKVPGKSNIPITMER